MLAPPNAMGCAFSLLVKSPLGAGWSLQCAESRRLGDDAMGQELLLRSSVRKVSSNRERNF